MEGSSSSNTKNVEINKEIVEQEQEDTMELFDLNHPELQINEEQQENADRLRDFDLNHPQPQISEEEQEKENADRLHDFDLNHPQPQISEEEQEKENADTLQQDFDLNHPQPQINEEEREKEAADTLIELMQGLDFNNQENQMNEPEGSSRSKKRTRTSTESKKVDGSEWGVDPLEVTEEIVLKYRDFIQEIYQMLKDDEEEMKDKQKDDRQVLKIEWKKWKEILKRANVLVETLNEGMNTLAMGMEWMKSVEELKEEYSIREKHVPDLIALLRDINTRIESSPHLKVVSDLKNRDEAIKMCLQELEKCKEELTEMVELIHELKAMDHLQQHLVVDELD